MDRRLDPRSIVTPYAFSVHPDLLGKPLATPLQRLGAILIDLLVIFLLSQVGAFPLAVASVGLLFWLAFRKPGRDAFGKLFRVAVGCLGFLVLSTTVIVVLAIRYSDDLEQLVEEMESTGQVQITGDSTSGAGSADPSAVAGFLDVIRAVQGASAFGDTESRDEAQAIANQLAQNAYDLNLPRSDIRGLLEGLIPEDAPWAGDAGEIIDEALESLAASDLSSQEPAPALTEPEAAAAGEGAPSTEVSGEAETLSEVALDSISDLLREILLLEEDKADLEEALANAEGDLEAAQNTGVFSWLWNLIDELGLGFGWAALYLTITHAWWKGTSVGKKIFRIRVVMIDLRPLNWWLSFERAGGYAAGFATGFLGFAQIFWDPNRQAIHDKVSETIVIQEGGKAVPGPWIEEGKAQWARARSGRSEPETR
jgi:hypothetical protein